jgi:hypothetical protein
MRIQVVRQLCGLALGLLMLVPSARASEPMNACGCYRHDQGVCQCTRKSKCGCPEECEPMGCEQKRQREADRAAAQALKQIAEREKKAAETAHSTKKAATVTKAAKRDKAAEKAERSAQEAMKAAMRAADKANPTPTKPARSAQKDDDPLPR